MKKATRIYVGLLAVFVSYALAALMPAEAAGQAAAPASYRLVAPPEESTAKAADIYEPIVRFLSRETGHPFVYVHLVSWLEYERWIWMNKGDLYFDGPHFAAWRIQHQGASLGPAIPQPQQWRLYTWRGNKAVNSVADTYGLRLCAPPAPNFGALWASALYPNPVRQPYFVDIHNWAKIYHALAAHRCDVAVGPKTLLDKLDPSRTTVKVLARSPDYPNKTFTLSRSIPKPLRRRIVQALLSPAGQAAMHNLRAQFANGRPFVSAAPAKYAHVDDALTAYWGATYKPVIARLQEEGVAENAARRNHGHNRTARAASSTMAVE